MVGQPMAVLMYYYDISKASSPNTPYDASDANNAGGELIAADALLSFTFPSTSTCSINHLLHPSTSILLH